MSDSSKQRNKKKKSTHSSSTSSASGGWGAKVHTLDTIDAYSSSLSSSTSSSLSSSSSSTFKIQHIPNLPSSEHAQSILKRIQNEFQILVQKRGYNITSVTELCCCDDGFNYLSNDNNNNNNSNNNRGAKKRGRKIRTMPNNVLGYNLTHGYRGRGRGNTAHRIHLRLRHPRKHGSFYPYEDIAGTMCHELAHCEVGAHNAKFYKLMDEIMEQYSVFLVKGLVLDKSGFPMGSDQAYTLGRGGGGTSNGSANNRNAAGLAAKQRLEARRKLGIGRSYVLGGGMSYIQDIQRKENDQRKYGFNIYGNGITNYGGAQTSSSSLANLPPREAARVAAERRVEERRKIDSLYCLPCQEIIEILDGSSSDDEEDENGQNKVSGVDGNLKQAKVKTESYVIDLVDSSDDELNHDRDRNSSKNRRSNVKKVKTIKEESSLYPQNWSCPNCTFANKSNAISCQICKTIKRQEQISIQPNLDNDKSSRHWTCSKCTFAENKQLSLSCEVCGAECKSTEGTDKVIEKIVRQDFIEDVKSKEKDRSLRDFNGFNIYGDDKKSSSTMKHLT